MAEKEPQHDRPPHQGPYSLWINIAKGDNDSLAQQLLDGIYKYALTRLYMTGFVKTRLPHTSGFTTLKDHHSM